MPEAASDGALSEQVPSLALLERELDRLTKSAWDVSGSLSLGLGVESNPLLSPEAPVARTAVFSEIEGFAFLPTWQALRITALLNGSCTRFPFEGGEGRGRQSWFLHLGARSLNLGANTLSAALTAYLNDEVLDLSATSTGHWVAPLRVWGGKGSLSVRRPLFAGFLLEVEGTVHRCAYLDFNGDFTEPGMQLHLERPVYGGASLGLSFRQLPRLYDSRGLRTAAGRERAGTRLRLLFEELELELAWRHVWHGRWLVSVKGLQAWCSDKDSGFHDYGSGRISSDCSWRGEAWSLRLRLQAEKARYEIQTVGMGLNPPARRREDLETSLRLERRLAGGRGLWVESSAQRSRSNEDASDYLNKILQIGLTQEF